MLLNENEEQRIFLKRKVFQCWKHSICLVTDLNKIKIQYFTKEKLSHNHYDVHGTLANLSNQYYFSFTNDEL